MSTPSYFRKAQIVLALLIIGLLFVFSVCAVADRGRDGRSDDRRGKESSKYRPHERDSKTIHVRTGKSYRPDQKYHSDSDHSVSYRPGDVRGRNHPRDYRPQTGKSYRPDPNYRSGSDRSISIKLGNIQIRSSSKDYNPPTYRSGRYYYSEGKHNRPYRYGHWSFSYHSDFNRKSIYFHYGILPYIQMTRVYDTPRPRHFYTSTYLKNNTVELDQTLEDIRDSWVNSRFDLVERHVKSYSKIGVSLDGRYDYSISAEDYLDMTYDTLEDIQTVSFVWENIREYNDGSAVAYAKHTYYDSSRSAKVVYLGYDLERFDRTYVITEVNSSLQSLY